MASKKDKTTLAARKARKQKGIAIAGGVLLLGLVAIQGPKLWKQLSPPAPQQSTAVVAPAVAGAVTPTLNTPPARSTATVVLAGVSISSGTAVPQAHDGKLLSFSLFKIKDPFVPQASDASSAAAAPTTEAAGANAPSASASASGAAAAASPAKPTYATIEVNGKGQQLTLKEKFPKVTPTFVLVALTRSAAKIGVAGGAFESGKALRLQMGKQATLVDTATGVRYELKLVYAGTQPEKTEEFTSAAATPTQAKTP